MDEPRSKGKVERRDFLPLLNGLNPKPSGEWTMFSCPLPGHGSGGGDRNRSAGLSKSGYIGCFAGCDFKELADELRKRGGDTNGAHPARSSPRGSYGEAPIPKNKIPDGHYVMVEAYEYRDAAGTLIAVKKREEAPDADSKKGYDKRFRWRLPDSQSWDGFQGKLKLEDVPLWGCESLPDDKSIRVWFAEGEKATKAIRAQGELAVCTGSGSSQREFGESLEVLRGRDVLLWPDNAKDGVDYMREVQKALRGIARTATVIRAPVGPTEDAHEYFYRDKGTVDALLANVLTKPQVDEIGHDHFRVRIPVDGGEVAWEFADLRTGRSMGQITLQSNATISLVRPGAEVEPYNQELNLKSLSTRESLRRALEQQFGGKGDGLNWATLQSTAYARVVTAWEETDRVMHLMDMPDIGDNRFLIDRWLPWKAPTIIFGKGGSLKSYIVGWLILHLAIGEDLPTGDTVKQSNVLVVDFEDPAAWQERFRRLLVGMGYGGYSPDDFLRQLPIKFWAADRGQSLESQRDALKRAIRKHAIDVIVIDSAMPACGGKPEDSDVSMAFFNTIHALDITSLIISHVGHAEFDAGMRRPYGNVLWENQPRRLFAVMRDDDEDTDDIPVMVRNTKVNRGKKAAPIGLTFHFDTGPNNDDTGPVIVDVLADVRSVAAFASKLGTAEQIRSALRRAKGPLTLGELCDELGIPDTRAGSIRQAVNRMPDVINLDKHTAGGRGKKARYGLLAPGESPPEPAPQAALEGMPEKVDARTAAKRRSQPHA